MSKLKAIITNPRVILLAVFLIISLIAISPQFGESEGVAIRSVSTGSAAAQSIPLPLESPDAGTSPKNWEVLQSINGNAIATPAEYYSYISTIEVNQTLLVQTDQATYRIKTLPLYAPLNVSILNGTNTTNVTREIIGVADIGLQVSEVPTNNIRKGLDLAGGTRVLLEPQETLSNADADLIVDQISRRLDVFGLSDVVVNDVTDFTGEKYILVEIAGANQEEVRQLLSQQGKFEALVGDVPIFQDGDDIPYVCRTPDCSGIDPQRGCGQVAAGSYSCAFRFTISLSQDAAQRMADATEDLEVIYDTQSGFLSENITFFLDGEQVNELQISADLQGQVQTQISITGSGQGSSQSAAAEAALSDMRQLQSVLLTGSLPVELEIIQSDSISPLLGEEFLQNAILVGALSLLAVVVIVTIRYRKPVIAIPTIIAMVSEVVILLGVAALFNNLWQIDLAAIAGIIIAVGTGVDDQIVIADETLNRKRNVDLSWKKKVKRAFFIIFTAYFTTVAAMIPLIGSGAGLLRGFAISTIVGVTIGVLITRPAFAAILEILIHGKQKKEK